MIANYRLTILLLTFMIGLTQAEDWKTYRVSDSPLPGNRVKAVCIDPSGVKWFGTENGLAAFDGTNWFTYTTQDKLADNRINKIVFEQSDYGPELWLATDNGVSVVSISNPDAITCATPYRSDNTGLVTNVVRTVAIDTGHVKWFATDQGVSIFTGDEWDTFSTNNLLPHNTILAISTRSDGWAYLATQGAGVARLRHDAVDGVSGASTIDQAWSSLPSDSVYSLYIDNQDVEWFGTKYGISRHEGYDIKSNWLTYSIDDGLPNNHVISINEDSSGAQWFGTANGVSRFKEDELQSWTTADALAGDSVYDIAVDHDGSLWFATNNGVSHFMGSSVSIDEPASRAGLIPLDVSIFPNPFNMKTNISFHSNMAGPVSIRIFNILGQLVRDLSQSSLETGFHKISWDGSDQSGTDVMSGVYFLELRTRQARSIKKLTIIK